MADMKDGVLKIERALENADVFDIQVGGDDQATWTAPSGETGISFNRALKILFGSGGLPATTYPTYEKMAIEGTELEEGSIAAVLNDDDDSKNGFYQKKNNQWLYNKFNPVEQSKAYVDASINTAVSINPLSSFEDKAVLKIADRDGKILFAVDQNGMPITRNDTVGARLLTRIKKLSATQVSVYQKGSSTNYIEYNFQRDTVAFDATNPSNNLDCWRIKGAYECNSDYTRLRLLVDIGAWECAIKEEGASDFFGTYHGDDVLTDAFFIINNQVYASAATFDITDPTSFEFVQTSNLYRCNTQTKVANCYRHYIWSDNSVTVEQKITWVLALDIKDAYLAMLPVKRTLDDGTQITDSGLRLYNGNVYKDVDMTTNNFTSYMTPASDGAISKLWGKTSGVGFEVEIVSTPKLPKQDFYISNAPQYNKFYFNAKGTGSAAGNYTTSVDESWHSITKFTLTTKN